MMGKAILVLAFATSIATPIVFAQTAAVSADAAQAQPAQSRKQLSPIGRALAGLFPQADQARAPTASDATAKTSSDHARPAEVDDSQSPPTELAATTHP